MVSSIDEDGTLKGSTMKTLKKKTKIKRQMIWSKLFKNDFFSQIILLINLKAKYDVRQKTNKVTNRISMFTDIKHYTFRIIFQEH